MPKYKVLENITESVFIKNTEIYLNPGSVVDIPADIASLPYFERLIARNALRLETGGNPDPEKLETKRNPDPEKTATRENLDTEKTATRENPDTERTETTK